jgi:hypothetical protein
MLAGGAFTSSSGSGLFGSAATHEVSASATKGGLFMHQKSELPSLCPVHLPLPCSILFSSSLFLLSLSPHFHAIMQLPIVMVAAVWHGSGGAQHMSARAIPSGLFQTGVVRLPDQPCFLSAVTRPCSSTACHHLSTLFRSHCPPAVARRCSRSTECSRCWSVPIRVASKQCCQRLARKMVHKR